MLCLCVSYRVALRRLSRRRRTFLVSRVSRFIPSPFLTTSSTTSAVGFAAATHTYIILKIRSLETVQQSIWAGS